jgi:hypothetical protein
MLVTRKKVRDQVIYLNPAAATNTAATNSGSNKQRQQQTAAATTLFFFLYRTSNSSKTQGHRLVKRRVDVEALLKRAAQRIAVVNKLVVQADRRVRRGYVYK